jgi:patatin-related protein
VVDTITGASAGGINGIFLAKALVRGQKIDRLQELWVREGAIEKLLNDHLSKDPPVAFDDPPPALLNAKRMYLELLKALDEMDGRGTGATKSGDEQISPSDPLVDQVDLYVTTTDFNGVVLPLRLTDEVVFERRHKNVFHFVYPRDGADPDIDFMPDGNPFLAYAARCTSSFPFAFEPMTLNDIDPILDRYGNYKDKPDAHSGSNRWKRFFRDYGQASGKASVPPERRAFADGGALDNKPFGYAIASLSKRHADYPVSRKLLYVEPAPEHPEDDEEAQRRPDFVQNSLAALSSLPMYETIREDLQRVNERNRQVLRLNRVLDKVDYDTDQAMQSKRSGEAANVLESTEANQKALRNLSDKDWSELYLDDMIKRKGRAYAAYHRLEIGAVTDDLARVVTRGAGLSEDSDQFAIFRSLTRAWRRLRYLEHPPAKPDSATETQFPINRFLTNFNLAYPIRRITFLRTRIEFLLSLDREELQTMYETKWPSGFVVTDEHVQEFRRELRRVYSALKQPQANLRKAGRQLFARPKPGGGASSSQQNRHQALSELREEIVKKVRGGVRADNTLDPGVVLKRFLSGTKKGVFDSTEAETDRRALSFLRTFPDIRSRMNRIADGIAVEVTATREAADLDCRRALGLDTGAEPALSVPVQIVRECLQNYFRNYDDYDMIIFPVTYETEVGEPSLVDVFRVSPEDAKALIDERATNCHKLAGTALGHFAAFLEERWRENDILWGRLDGAERIISAVLPSNHAQKESLIREAQAAIVYETIQGMTPKKRDALLCEAAMRTGSGKAEPKLLVSFIENLKRDLAEPLKSELDRLIVNNQLEQHYDDIYAINSTPDPKSTLTTAGRATTILGKMFEKVADDNVKAGKRYAAWVTRAGLIFWGLVELATPKSIWNILFRYWLKLLYLVELILVLVGTVFVVESIQRFGLILFGVTVAVNFVVSLLNDFMLRRVRWLRIGKLSAVILLLAIVGIGVFAAYGLTVGHSTWDFMVEVHEWFSRKSAWRKWGPVVVLVVLVLFFLIKDLLSYRRSYKPRTSE